MSILPILQSLEVPPLYYDWTTGGMKDCDAKTKISKLMSEVDTLIKNGGFVLISLKDNLLASRLGVTLLKAALLRGYIKVGYLTPAKIMELKVESWDNGDLYREYQRCDLLVVDSVTPNTTGAKFAAYLEFIEERLVYKKATVVTSTHSADQIFNERILSLLAGVRKIGIEDSML